MIALSLALAVLFAVGERRAVAEDASCGTPGLPPCPLQAWMRQRIAGPLASNELEKLARGLDAAADFSPDPAWTEWRGYATGAAGAARRGDVASADASVAHEPVAETAEPCVCMTVNEGMVLFTRWLAPLARMFQTRTG